MLAHSSGDWTWCARIDAVAAGDATTLPITNEQTTIFAREDGPGQKWQALPKLSGRAIALAGRSSQLAVLLSNGDWLLLSADGSATGQPLPAKARLVTLADDGRDLWAIGSVSGGIAAANLDLARQRAATRPTTTQYRDEAINADQLHFSHSLPSKLVVFHEQNGRWVAVAELPADLVMPLLTDSSQGQPEVTSADISLAVIAGAPTIAVKTSSNAVRIMTYRSTGDWGEVAWPRHMMPQPIDAFSLLTDGNKPAFWWTTAIGPGELFSDVARSASPVQLPWVSKDPFDGTPAATFSGGYVCLFGLHASDVLEQRYKLTGQPVETAEPIALPSERETILPVWLEAAFLASMGFAVGSSMHRQWLSQSEPEEIDETFAPAPLWLRFAAGMIDLIPVIAATVYLLLQADSFSGPNDIPSVRTLIIFFSAFALYILHTTAIETLTGRSIGKWLCGLKVVSMTGEIGELPSRSQFLIRNLLRIVDPVVMVIVSPLHQRSADSVAGTLGCSRGKKRNCNRARQNRQLMMVRRCS